MEISLGFSPMAIQHEKNSSFLFAIFDSEQRLHIYNQQQQKTEQSFYLKEISNTKKGVLIEFYTPYVCVAERYGLNAVLINLDTQKTTHFQREDYHADVSSFSIALISHNKRILLMHQSQWNRLDITDLETQTCLTNRNIVCKRIESPDTAANYHLENYLDYFHSLLHVSPSGTNFLVNGWVWSPVDSIIAGTITDFLKTYELSTVWLDYGNSYNWDRPVTFIDDDTFVIAIDDPNSDMISEEELEDWVEHRLRFYRFSDRENHQHLPHYKQVNADIFTPDSDGEIKGKLYYSQPHNMLIAISVAGVYIVDLDGNIHGSYKAENTKKWRFNSISQCFYYLDENRLVTVDIADLIQTTAQ